jgi:hypothetical protein
MRTTRRTFVARNEFVGKRETGHEAALLEPEYGAKGSREEDALDGGESDQPVGKRVDPLLGDPLDGPLGLSLDRRHGLDGAKENVLLDRVLDVGVDQEGIHFLFITHARGR